jgi:hypothetical protein
VLAPFAINGNGDEDIRNRALRPVQEVAILPEKEIKTGKGGRLIAILERLRLRYGDGKQRRLPNTIRIFVVCRVLWAVERAFQQFGAQQRAGLIPTRSHHALVDRDDIKERKVIWHLATGEMPVGVRILVQTFVQ